MDGLEDAFAPAGTSPGWAKLGALLAGGSRGSERAGMQGYEQGVRLESALLDARKRRDAEAGRQAMAKAAADAGDNDFANAILQGAGDNIGQIGNYRLDRQKLGLIDAANALAADPHGDLNALNRRMIVIGGKPVDLTQIQDHTVLNPLVTPDAQSLQTNEIGRAMIGADNARASASYASAARSRAGISADKAANYDLVPNEDGTLVRVNKLTGEATPVMVGDQPMHGAPRGGSGGGSALTSEEIKALFGNDDGTLNQGEYRRFLDFQRSRNIKDAHEAARQFSTDFSNVDHERPEPEPAGEEPSLLSAFADKVTSPFRAKPQTDPAKQKSAADAARPQSKADYDALPSGTLYMDPDGTLRRKK